VLLALASFVANCNFLYAVSPLKGSPPRKGGKAAEARLGAVSGNAP
jgi:hypothetical protein